MKLTFYFISICLLSFLLLLTFKNSNKNLNEADNFYHQGENATTIAEKKQAFNDALALYLSMEQENTPQFGNGKLYYNIGNTYFQLGEYPWALLYYKKAQNLMPRSEQVQENIATTSKLLQLPKESAPTFFEKLFQPAIALSIPERLQMFSITGIITLIVASFYIWKPHPLIKQTMQTFVFIILMILASLTKSYYFTPLQGILIHAVDLRRSDSNESPKVSNNPLRPGTTVNLIDIPSKNSWIKITTSQGDFGYIPREAVRTINLF